MWLNVLRDMSKEPSMFLFSISRIWFQFVFLRSSSNFSLSIAMKSLWNWVFFLYLRAVFVFEKCKVSILIKYGSGDVTWISSSSMMSSSKNMLSTNVLNLEVTREGKLESNSRSNFRLYKMNKKRSSKQTNNIVEMKCI